MILCFFEIIPHLELLINPSFRVLTPQKLTYYIGFIFLLAVLARKKTKLIDAPESILIVLFVSSTIISSLLGINTKVSLINVSRHFGFIIIYILLSNTSKSFRNIEQVLFSLLPVGIIFFVVGFFYRDQYYSPVVDAYTTLGGGLATRGTIYNLNANTVGYISAFLLITALFFLFKTRIKAKKHLFYYPAIALFFYAMVISLSRGAFISLLLAVSSVAMVYPFYKKKRDLFGLLFFIVLASAILALPFSILMERLVRGALGIFQLEGSYGYDPDLAYGRVEQASIALSILRERPLFGWGFMTLRDLFSLMPFYARESVNHFYYLQLAVHIGLSGLLLYVSFFVVVLVKLLNSIKRLKRDRQKAYVLGSFLLGLFVFSMIKGFFAPLLYEIWITAGLSSAFVKAEAMYRKDKVKHSTATSGSQARTL